MDGTDDNLQERIVELEIRLALQDELLDSLNDTVTKMRQTIDLQQDQIRLLYRRIQHQTENGSNGAYSLADEIPPHY